MNSAQTQPGPGPDNSGPGGRLGAVIDRIDAASAVISGVLVVVIAAMLFGEVIARYILNMPTIWTQDVAVALQLWFTYLAMAYALRKREMIRITAVVGLLGPTGRRVVEAFSLLSILAFSILAVWFATDIMLESIRLGRRAPTMLELPNWISELPVIIGFSLLALQAVVDLLRLPWRPAPDFTAADHPPDGD